KTKTTLCTLLAALPTLAAGATRAAAQAHFAVRSADIRPGARIKSDQVFSGMGCTGKNVSPALSWSGAPKGTKSFAVTMYDPDAPTGSGWWHWVIFNIPASATSLAAGAGDPSKNLAPAGSTEGNTDFG